MRSRGPEREGDPCRARPLCALDGCSLLKGLGGGSSSTRFFMKARASVARNSRLLTVGLAHTQHPLFSFLELKHRMSQTLPIQTDGTY